MNSSKDAQSRRTWLHADCQPEPWQSAIPTFDKHKNVAQVWDVVWKEARVGTLVVLKALSCINQALNFG